MEIPAPLSPLPDCDRVQRFVTSIRNYRKSLQLNSENENAVTMLKTLGIE